MRKGPGIGRLYKLDTKYPNVKFEVTTVNQNPLKSLTLETRFWYEKTDELDSRSELNKLFRKCKRTLFNESNNFYDVDKIIHIQDIPNDLSQKTSKVFCLFEFTLFVNKKDLTEMEVTLESNRITKCLYEDVFKGQDSITCSKG